MPVRIHERRVASEARPRPTPPAAGDAGEEEPVRPGQRNEDLGDIYQTILYQGDDTVIYINEHDQLRMSYPIDTAFPPGIGPFEADAVTLQHQPTEGLSPEQRRSFMTLIGRAWVIIFEGAAPGADRVNSAAKILTQAATYRTARLGEVSRAWFLCFGALQLALLWLAGAVAWLVRDGIAQFFGPSAPLLANAFVMGATGAMVSICLRLGSIAVDPASGKRLHWMETAGRFFVAGVTAMATCLFYRLGLITLGPAGSGMTVPVLTLALFAGASERLFPSLGGKLPLPK